MKWLQATADSHTPRVFNNELYVLLSATGELVKVNLNLGNTM
jgi:hypothetical protein